MLDQRRSRSDSHQQSLYSVHVVRPDLLNQLYMIQWLDSNLPGVDDEYVTAEFGVEK